MIKKQAPVRIKAKDRTLVCENCLHSKLETECNWVNRPEYRYILCDKCVSIKNPLVYVPVIEVKEKVHLQCPKCKSKKTINSKIEYLDTDFLCKKCNENTLQFI